MISGITSSNCVLKLGSKNFQWGGRLRLDRLLQMPGFKYLTPGTNRVRCVRDRLQLNLVGHSCIETVSTEQVMVPDSTLTPLQNVLEDFAGHNC